MREPLYWKIRRVIGGIIRRLSRHYYGCCQNNFKNCDKCKYVIEKRSGSGE